MIRLRNTSLIGAGLLSLLLVFFFAIRQGDKALPPDSHVTDTAHPVIEDVSPNDTIEMAPSAELLADDAAETVTIVSEEAKPSMNVSRMPAGYQLHQFPMHNGALDRSMSELEVANAIDRITGVESASRGERFEALAALKGLDLPDAQAQRLLNYLGDENRYTGMSHNAMYVLINELVAVFHDNDSLDNRYLAVSHSLINNEKEKEVIRDYTLQGLSRGIAKASPEQVEQIQDVFWENVGRSDTSLAGTALHALRREHKATALSTGEEERLQETVEAYVQSSPGERTRIAAMQVAVHLGLEDLSADLVGIVETSNSTVPEKIAALAALNRLGHPSAATLYEQASQSDEPLLARVAQKILQKTQSSQTY